MDFLKFTGSAVELSRPSEAIGPRWTLVESTGDSPADFRKKVGSREKIIQAGAVFSSLGHILRAGPKEGQYAAP